MLCAISGEAPQVPVASRKSGNVFEKRLIEAYIQENGKDPVNGEELSVDDLVELKTARVVKARPPVLTSIPSLLSAFQNEWDALALESYTLKQHLSQLRQELSTALYNNDAAVRVIARLTRERDEARDALGKVSMQDRRNTSTTNGDAMQVDGATLAEETMAKIDATQERLSKTRRKRPVPEGWAAPADVQSFEPTAPSKALVANSKSLMLDHEGNTALLGGADGSACTISVSTKEVLQAVQGDGGAINDVALWEVNGQPLPILASASGQVSVVENGQIKASFKSHAGPATGVALHPSGDMLASVGVDKSYVLYDLAGAKKVSQVFTDSELLCCQFHPDGHLLAAGSNSKQVKVFDVKTGTIAAEFSTAAPPQSLSFSENGIWLAVAVKGSSTVGIWDLRKGTEIKTLDFGSQVECVRFDYTGQYLAAAGPGCVAVQHYDKSAKAWSELLSKAVAVTAVCWGPLAKSLVVVSANGSVAVLE